MTQVATGTLLAGKYRLESLIGRGGMGSVWRAEHLGLCAPVAVKLLDLIDVRGSGEALNRFHREAHAAASIRSPHVVQILDYGVDEASSAPFIVMELMEGESLAQRLTRSGSISPAEAARVLTHVARALSRAHEAGIVHRDLKPDNVFLVRNEDEEVAKVLDFGIAKAHAQGLGGDSATRTGAVMGTAYYMSPEQISGAKKVDLRTDLWAFGVMACECLTGTRPFEADTIGGLTLRICVEPIPVPSSFAPVPAGFDQWFLRSVSRDASQRFQSAREAADALRHVCTGEYVGQRYSTPLPSLNTIADGSSTATGGPLSRSGADLSEANKPKHRGVMPWLVGGALFAVVSGTLWSRMRADRGLHAAAASGSARVAATLLEQPGAAVVAAARAEEHDEQPAVASSTGVPVSGTGSPRAAATAASQRNALPGLYPHCKPCPSAHATGTTPLAPSSAQSIKLAPPEPPKPAPPAATTRDLLDNR